MNVNKIFILIYIIIYINIKFLLQIFEINLK